MRLRGARREPGVAPGYGRRPPRTRASHEAACSGCEGRSPGRESTVINNPAPLGGRPGRGGHQPPWFPCTEAGHG